MKKLIAKIYWTIMSTIAVIVVTPIEILVMTDCEFLLVWQTLDMGIMDNYWTFDIIAEGTIEMYEGFTKDVIGLYKDGYEMINSGDLA